MNRPQMAADRRDDWEWAAERMARSPRLLLAALAMPRPAWPLPSRSPSVRRPASPTSSPRRPRVGGGGGAGVAGQCRRFQRAGPSDCAGRRAWTCSSAPITRRCDVADSVRPPGRPARSAICCPTRSSSSVPPDACRIGHAASRGPCRSRVARVALGNPDSVPAGRLRAAVARARRPVGGGRAEGGADAHGAGRAGRGARRPRRCGRRIRDRCPDRCRTWWWPTRACRRCAAIRYPVAVVRGPPRSRGRRASCSSCSSPAARAIFEPRRLPDGRPAVGPWSRASLGLAAFTTLDGCHRPRCWRCRSALRAAWLLARRTFSGKSWSRRC